MAGVSLVWFLAACLRAARDQVILDGMIFRAYPSALGVHPPPSCTDSSTSLTLARISFVEVGGSGECAKVFAGGKSFVKEVPDIRSSGRVNS